MRRLLPVCCRHTLPLSVNPLVPSFVPVGATFDLCWDPLNRTRGEMAPDDDVDARFANHFRVSLFLLLLIPHDCPAVARTRVEDKSQMIRTKFGRYINPLNEPEG